MDALAAYGSESDDSGSESMPTPITKQPAKSTASSASASTGSSATTPGSKSIPSLSSMLPPPKSAPVSKPGPTSAANKSSQPKVSKYKTMPTLESDSDSEEESEFRKKARLNASANAVKGGVGALFAMLPAPKNVSGATSSPSSSGAGASGGTSTVYAKTNSFMPRTLQKKPLASAKKSASLSSTAAKEGSDDDEDSEGDEQSDSASFFPLGAAVNALPKSEQGSSGGADKAASNSYIPLFFDKKPLTTAEREEQSATYVDVSTTNEQYAYPSNEQYAYSGNEQYAYSTNEQYAYYDYSAYGQTEAVAEAAADNSGSNSLQLDDKAMLQLGMRKGREGPIQFVDISAKDQMSQAQHVQRAMQGSNSQPKPVDLSSISHLKPSTTQKRKHNIMSLAYQAKANEHELNASWAASRKTKAETQAKYGF
ncbi:hypothetical protein BGW38_010673 [Lunasporangiospora selenospora]|uniref:Proline-rich protein PRCC n=1 Tax=Lunasporangiospora selenospora TaxID=979761 RepID=A0A9P6G470_9FUNG|nr:hypothetical protein BGW38_010673 [Lunasporangiospora selenospora]